MIVQIRFWWLKINMKYTLLILILMSNACFAVRMEGFGARYYDEDTENYSDEHDTNKSLIPDVIIGGIVM